MYIIKTKNKGIFTWHTTYYEYLIFSFSFPIQTAKHNQSHNSINNLQISCWYTVWNIQAYPSTAALNKVYSSIRWCSISDYVPEINALFCYLWRIKTITNQRSIFKILTLTFVFNMTLKEWTAKENINWTER